MDVSIFSPLFLLNHHFMCARLHKTGEIQYIHNMMVIHPLINDKLEGVMWVAFFFDLPQRRPSFIPLIDGTIKYD